MESVVYNGLTEFEKQAYRYDSHPWFQQINVNQQWKNPFLTIYYTNTVLDRLSLLKNDNTKEYQAIKGAALFIRAFTFFSWHRCTVLIIEKEMLTIITQRLDCH